MLFPREQHSLLYGGWIFNCDADLPTFSFGVGDATITVPADYMNYETILGNKCYGGLQPSTDIGINVRICSLLQGRQAKPPFQHDF